MEKGDAGSLSDSEAESNDFYIIHKYIRIYKNDANAIVLSCVPLWRNDSAARSRPTTSHRAYIISIANLLYTPLLSRTNDGLYKPPNPTISILTEQSRKPPITTAARLL